MKTNFLLLVLFLITSICSMGQSPDVSGILKTQSEFEQYNSICIRFENPIVADEQPKIKSEFSKYVDIVSVDFENISGSDYVYIKYSNPMTPNQLLAILDKINKRGHYLNGGTPVYYQKDQFIYFIR